MFAAAASIDECGIDSVDRLKQPTDTDSDAMQRDECINPVSHQFDVINFSNEIERASN